MVININGPDGNAFAILGIAKRCLRQMGVHDEDISTIFKEATSKDYHHLLRTIKREIPAIQFVDESDDDDFDDDEG